MNTMVGYQDMGGRIPRYGLRNLEKTPPGKDQRDAALTKRWMDAVGVDVAVLFPTPMLALGVHPQVEVEIALSRAYNRWLCERVLAHEPRLVSMLYLPFNDPDATYAVREGVRREEGRGRIPHHLDALQAGARQPVHEDLCAAGGDGPADRLPRLLPLARPGAGHAQPLHLGACARLRLVQHVPSRQLDHQRHSRALSQAQGDVARKRARLDPVHDAALRQRIHDAHVGGPCPQEAAARLHARHVFRLAADGDHRHGAAGADACA